MFIENNNQWGAAMNEKFVWFMIGVMVMAFLALCLLCLKLPFGILIVIGAVVLTVGTIVLMFLRHKDKGKAKIGLQGGEE